MSDSSAYFGWAWHRGHWHRLCGPLPISEAARELSRVLRVRGWSVPTSRQALTTGAVPNFDPTRRNAPAACGGAETASGPVSASGDAGAPSGATGGPTLETLL